MITYEAIKNFIQGAQVSDVDAGLLSMIVATLINVVLGFFLLRLGEKTSLDGHHGPWKTYHGRCGDNSRRGVRIGGFKIDRHCLD